MKGKGDHKQIPATAENKSFLGCMGQNKLGDTFTYFDYRVGDPKSLKGKAYGCTELGAVMFATNIRGRVPNSLTAWIPRWEADLSIDKSLAPIRTRVKQLNKRASGNADRSTVKGRAKEFMTRKKNKEYQAVEKEDQMDLLRFETAKPAWNEEQNGLGDS